MHQELGLHSGDNLDFALLRYNTVYFGGRYVCMSFGRDVEFYTAV